MNKKTIVLIFLVIALLAVMGVWKWKNKPVPEPKEQVKNEQISNQNEQTYYDGEEMSVAEAEALNNFLTKDIGGTDLGNYYRVYMGKIYYWDEGPQAVPSMIPIDAEPSQFKTFTSRHCADKIYKFNNCARYGKDNNKVFLGYDEIKGADPSTFVLLGTNYGLGGEYSKDKNSVFFETSKLHDADVNSFELLNDFYGKDKTRVYYEKLEIKEADPKTFMILDSKRRIARDKDSFFWREEKIEQSRYGIFNIDKYLK